MNNDIAPEDLPECTQALLDILSPEDDLRLYAQIEDRIKEGEQERHQQLEETQKQLKALSQTLAQLRLTSTRDAASWKSSKKHQDDIEELQIHHYDLAQKINESEAQLQIVEREMEKLNKDLDNLEHTDMESQEEMDKDAIAVGLFRKMGFVPCYQKYDTLEDSTVFESIMVRSETKNRSTELEVNDEMMQSKAITPYILANQLWLASE